MQVKNANAKCYQSNKTNQSNSTLELDAKLEVIRPEHYVLRNSQRVRNSEFNTFVPSPTVTSASLTQPSRHATRTTRGCPEHRWPSNTLVLDHSPRILKEYSQFALSVPRLPPRPEASPENTLLLGSSHSLSVAQEPRIQLWVPSPRLRRLPPLTRAPLLALLRVSESRPVCQS